MQMSDIILDWRNSLLLQLPLLTVSNANKQRIKSERIVLLRKRFK